MTIITTTGMTFVQAATMLATHLADHALPEPASLSVATSYGCSDVTAQLRSNTVSGIAVDLLAWADTLSMVTLDAWRPPERDRVHLSLISTLTGSTGTVKLRVFGGAQYDPLRFADLAPGDHRTVSPGQLRSWAATTSHTTKGGTTA